ncbi:MAG: A/G-specific adenine glycosylase [Methylacidiphilales bacterium]|nr:A/G-specific adenine glycosylase [Candidatus Methylacidiphilales bacterium]
MRYSLAAKQWRSLRAKLIGWYGSAKRDLPWRRTSDPYAITVSEFMLQQTQVVTVIPYYERWLKLFPTWEALAHAKEHDVIKAWEGLGYYRRARNLQALAKAIAQAGGAMPRSEEGLRALPGIGPYTAAAVGSIAFGLPLAVLDGNVMRVLTRLLALADDISRPQTRAKLQQIANDFLARDDPSTHNQAIMELGATVCLPRKPLCLICPLQDSCRGRDRAGEFPVKSRVVQVKRTETVAILKKGKSFYCEQVTEGKPWHGLWRFPDFDPARMEQGNVIARIKYGITKYSVTMRAVSAKWSPADGSKGKGSVVAVARRATEGQRAGRYLTANEMHALAFAAPHRKLAETLTLSNPSS